jgi:hypothetical protein
LDDKTFALPDEILDKHLADTGVEEEVEVDPDLDDELESPEAEEEDTDEESPSDEEEETEEEESGDSDPDDEADKEEEEEEEEDSSESFLPKFDRKKIEADPELNKAYKHMQAQFTKRVQEASAARREADEMKADFESFLADISSEEGAEDFLVKIALSRPEVFKKAYERAEDLTEDPDELKKFERGQDLKRREQELERRERTRKMEEQERRVAEIESVVDKAAGRLGMDDAETKIAHEYVANAIFRIRAAGGKDISSEEILKAVKRAASDLSVQKRKVREATEREVKLTEKQRAKEKARKLRRTAPPRSTAAPASRRAANKDVPEGVDPLMYSVDRAFGLTD